MLGQTITQIGTSCHLKHLPLLMREGEDHACISL